MGRKFFEGIQFKPRDAAIGCLVMASPFIMSLKTEFSHYQYYIYEQPSYKDLHVIKGIIVGDLRKPPRPYNDRNDGIYVDIGDKKINILR